MNKKISFLVLLIFISGQFAIGVNAQELKPEVEFPVVFLYSDGTYTPDTTSLLLDFGVPEDVLFSESPEYNVQIQDEELLDAGFTSVYYDQSLNRWRVSFASIIEAPLIDMWQSDNSDDDGSIRLQADEEDIRSGPPNSARSEHDMGLPFWYGDISYQLENETDDSGSSWEYTTDFLVDNYNILYLDQIGDYNSNNLTVTVSYVEDLTYTNLNATYAYNVTFLNEPVNGFNDYWFRFDFENSNSSFDEYVANIELQNFNVKGGRYALDVDASTQDSRYQSNYVGGLTSAITPRAVDYYDYYRRIDGSSLKTSSGPRDTSLSVSSWLDDQTATDALSVPSIFDTNADTVVNQARGWLTEEELENSIKQSIVDMSDEDNIDDISEVDDLELTSAILNYDFPATTIDKMDKALNAAADKTDDLANAMIEAQKETIERILIVSDDEDTLSTQFLGDIVDGVTSGVSSVIDTTAGGISTVLDGAAGFGSDIIGAVSGGVSEATGAVTSGAATVVSSAGTAVGGIADSLTGWLPWIVGGLLLVAVIFYFLNKNNVM